MLFVCCCSVAQFSAVAQLCLTLCDPMNRSMPGLPVHHQLLEFTQTHVIESVMPSNHLILCHPLLLLPSIFPSIRVFSNESALLIRKEWFSSFSSVAQSERMSNWHKVSDSLRPHKPQHARPPCPSSTPGVYPNSCHWVGDAIQPSHPLSFPSPPALNLSQHQGLFLDTCCFEWKW